MCFIYGCCKSCPMHMVWCPFGSETWFYTQLAATPWTCSMDFSITALTIHDDQSHAQSVILIMFHCESFSWEMVASSKYHIIFSTREVATWALAQFVPWDLGLNGSTGRYAEGLPAESPERGRPPLLPSLESRRGRPSKAEERYEKYPLLSWDVLICFSELDWKQLKSRFRF